MSLSKLRYSLTNHKEKIIFTYENEKLLIHTSVNDYDLLRRLEDDLKLMPEIRKTIDDIDIKFYRYDYNEEIYSKDEPLSFVLASINKEWNVVKGINLTTGKSHYWLQKDNIVYDPSLAIITTEEIYSKHFKKTKEIKNEDVYSYLKENNNLWKFYQKGMLEKFKVKREPNFSISFIEKIRKEFNKKVTDQYTLDKNVYQSIKEHMFLDDFIRLRQVLTQKRISYLESKNIALHPDVNPNILESINEASNDIKKLMKEKYDCYVDYHGNTLGNCYALSICLNLYNGDFKLIQGGFPYKKTSYSEREEFYQHSWLEIDDYVYDPALRIITPKNLYYMFFTKQDEYSKEQTETIVKRLGFNLTHFRDFINGVQIGNDETFRYRMLVKEIDSPEFKKQGEELISLLNSKNNNKKR